MRKQNIELKKDAPVCHKQNCTKKSDIALSNNALIYGAKYHSESENSKTTDTNKPTIFNKKSKIVVTKPLIYIESDTGKPRHFTPAAQE
jgi:hypothetical protein